MARKITETGIRALEQNCLNSLVEGRSNPADSVEFVDAQADVAVWMRYHFDNEQLDLIRRGVDDALSGKAGR